MVHLRSDFKIHHNHNIQSMVTFTGPLSILFIFTPGYLSFPYFITFPYLSFPFFSFANLSLPFLILFLIVKLTNWLTTYRAGFAPKNRVQQKLLSLVIAASHGRTDEQTN